MSMSLKTNGKCRTKFSAYIKTTFKFHQSIFALGTIESLYLSKVCISFHSKRNIKQILESAFLRFLKHILAMRMYAFVVTKNIIENV